MPGLTDFSCLEKQVEHEHLSGCLLAKLGLKDAIYDIFTKYESFKRRIGGASGYCIVSCSCQHVWGGELGAPLSTVLLALLRYWVSYSNTLQVLWRVEAATKDSIAWTWP